MLRSSLCALMVALAFSGCRLEYVLANEPIPKGPTLLPPTAGRRAIAPKSYRFRVAVQDFIDQTNSAGDLVRTIPDILTTTLFDNKRYDIYDRGQLRDKSAKAAEGLIDDLKGRHEIDGVIVGSITRFSPQSKELTIDVRLINVYSNAVMFAAQQTVHYTGVLDVKVDRDDVTGLSTKIALALPTVKDARIAATSGLNLVIGAGETEGVKKGMTIFVIASGDTLEDPSTGDALASRYVIAEAYVTAVEPKIAHATVYNKHVATWIRPADLVHFK